MIRSITKDTSRIQDRTQPQTTGGVAYGGWRDALSAMVEALRPGGEIEKTYMADIEQEGKLLGAQLRGGAVSRGLGNVTMGIPTTVAKQTGAAKQKLRAGMLEQYVGALQNLASLSFQEEQAGLSRAAQLQAATGGTPGLDAFGRPMRGTLAAAELDLLNRQVRQPQRMSAEALPSLYAAGGYGAGGYEAAPSLFGTIEGETDTWAGTGPSPAWDTKVYAGSRRLA